MIKSVRWRVRLPMRSAGVFFFNWPNPSSRNMVPGSTQPLTEMSTRNFPVGKDRPAREADNLTAICEPTIKKIWEPRRLTYLWASTACHSDSFVFSTLLLKTQLFRIPSTEKHEVHNFPSAKLSFHGLNNNHLLTGYHYFSIMYS
jgi:hypothetical protein